jgi:hypothetical protein
LPGQSDDAPRGARWKMHSVTVKQALELEVMEKAVVTAGAAGLTRVIRRVSFIDLPFSADVLNEKNILMPGDFYISSFFVVKDNPEQMLEILRLLLSAGSSGLCVISKYFVNLPTTIIEFANENNYPIIFINQDAPYGDIIRDIFTLILHNNEDTLIEYKLNSILDSNQSEETVKKTILSINTHLAKHVVAMYCICPGMENNKVVFIKETINSIKEWCCQKFRENILIVLTFENPDAGMVESKKKYIMDQIARVIPKPLMGISTLRNGLGQSGRAITEAMIASDLARIQSRSVVDYDGLGTYKYLLPLRDRHELIEFHDEVIGPILQYDRKYKQDLLNTVINFIGNEGDYERTAKCMSLHKNSIRYRISKTMDILNMQDRSITFYEHLAVAVKLHKILKEIETGEGGIRV